MLLVGDHAIAGQREGGENLSKVTSPFFGFHASQQINKSLVYFVWKGLNVVRSWVKPSDPNTAGQQAVRLDFASIVDSWHNAAMNNDDHTAWNTAASAVKYKPQSGFNRMIGVYRAIYEAGVTISYLWTYTNVAHAANAWSATWITSNHTAGDTYTMYYGTSPTSLWRSTSGVHLAGTVTIGPFNTTLAAGTKMYFKLVEMDVLGTTMVGSSGIYSDILT